MRPATGSSPASATRTVTITGTTGPAGLVVGASLVAEAGDEPVAGLILVLVLTA